MTPMMAVIVSLNVAFWVVLLACFANLMYNDRIMRGNQGLIRDNWKLIADNVARFDAEKTAAAQAKIAKSKVDLEKAMLRNKAFMLAIAISGSLLVAAWLVKLIGGIK